MAVQALYTKWRPATFDEVVGQEHVTYTLRNALAMGRIGHAYLFAGPRGTGKTTMARVLAKAMNCLAEDPTLRPDNSCPHCQAVNEGRYLDLIEIDAASHTSVDDVRDLRDRIAFSPNEGRYKIYIIDEVHRFSGSAFDALLKTIEEPPPHAVFILATTELHKVPQTILSRCQHFDFRRISLAEIAARLRALADAEGIDADDAALNLIARQATGSLRDAISLLDQLLMPGEALTLELAQAVLGTAASESVRALTTALIAGDIGAGLKLINEALDTGADPRQYAGQMVEYLRLVMLVQTGGSAIAEMTESQDRLVSVVQHAEQFPRAGLIQTIRRFNRAALDAVTGWQPQLPLELAFVESVDALYSASPESPSALPRPAVQRAVETPAVSAQEQTLPEERSAIPAAAPAPGVPTVDQVRGRWKDVMRVAREMDKAIAALLNSGGVYGVEGYTVVLQMPSDLLRDKIEMTQNRELIEQALTRVFELPLKVSCKVGSIQAGGASRKVDDLLAQDSLAAFAVNDLGGAITQIQDSEEN